MLEEVVKCFDFNLLIRIVNQFFDLLREINLIKIKIT